ncbi:M28 family peptidase [Massilia solisilvae]|uniref:M28 family peptidase n=1 Tax=Massilia solisilvae TaxID=1811225 RepID=A0ABT2BS03_9BURK|nr:M28 family peptidase [Massilia solisilvae]MCS0610845.1 M28 family peptidase [Massilia solisilvae]
METTDSALPECPGVAGCVAAVAAVCALAWACLATAALPPPASASAPPERFSAARAFTHVRELARTPRPVASPMNASARAYLVAALRSMGLDPQVQTATVQRQSMDNHHNVHVTLATVHNVIARLPGAARGRAPLLVASHYDSAADTFGASDAVASAAMLETLRALRAGPPLAGDTVFLFADGDNIGALGEQAFAEQHPLARQVGQTLRFRDLGNRGPAILQHVHGNAGMAIAAWSAGPNPRGSSFMREVSNLMPMAPATGPLASLAAPLLQFAAVAGRLGIFDTPQLFDRATLQHEGETMLALVRTLAGSPAASTTAEPDQVWFALPLLGMLHYPADSIWPVTRITCLLVFGVCLLAMQQSQVEAVDIAKGAFGYAFSAGVPLALFYLDGLHGALAQMVALAGPGDGGLRYMGAAAALTAAVFIALQRRLRARIGAMAASLGALAWLAVVLAVASWAAPGATCLLAWPIIGAALALAALHAPWVRALPSSARVALLLAGLVPAVALLVPAARDAYSMPTPFRVHIPLWLFAIFLGLALPLLAVAARRLPARAIVLAGAAALALPGSASTPPPDPLRPNPLVYYKDMPTWSEWWLSPEPELDDWSRRMFAGQPKRRRLIDVFGWDSDDLWYARAARTGVEFPYALLLKNEASPRHIAFDLTSKNSAPNIEMRLQGGKPWRALVNGRELSNDDQIRGWSLSMYGMGGQTLHFAFDLVGDPLLRVHVEERIPGVPEQALPAARPKKAYIPMTGQTVTSDILWFR